ncbi:MAG: ThiF family adenylyltransferase [Proteobacteria bacterium]|jgi:molybdopterin/thiamine biosynthesis adenylyltransferase|nr:ThiF family adenylyltransferase [Pseudomonadota bacterium]
MATNKFHHEEIYRGKDYAKKLQGLITICGVGALGSNLLDNLSRQGFANLRGIDKDRVDTHNLNTQFWNERDVGALKVAAAKQKVFGNIGVEIDTVDKELTAATVDKMLRGSALVLDCFDNNAARQIVQTHCRAKKIPCLHTGLFEDYGEVVWDDRYKVPKDSGGDVCDYPLARNIIMLTVAAASEEILDFFLASSPRHQSWSITLRDLHISAMH